MSHNSKAPVKIAQIGVGYWGPNLLRSLVAISDFDVRLVADASAQRREFIQSLYPGIRTEADAQRVLEDPDIEAVVIATPAHTHFNLAMAALQAGKHVLVEKPMATRLEEVDQIGQLALEKRRIAMVGHTFLFNSAVRYLKKIIDAGELGKIRYIYSQRLNLGRIRSDVDALWNLAPHDVSIIQYLLGNPQPKCVKRTGMAFIQEKIDDVVFLSIAYPDNIMAHIHVSWLDPHKVRTVTVVGSKKMAIYDDVAEHKIAIYDKGIDVETPAELGKAMDYDKGVPPNFVHRSGDIFLPALKWKEPLKEELEHFLACIRGEAQCLSGPDHAREVVAILSSSAGSEQ